MPNTNEPRRAGFLRLKHIIAPHGPIPVSRSTWYARVATGEFPAPVKIGRMSLWAVEDIDALVARLKDDAERHSPSTRPAGPAERA